MSTPGEREAFLWMQGRMVELLLRHDAARFGRTFGEQEGDQETTTDLLLAYYRELAVLFYLHQELLESILPRIKRRLSFEAPRQVMTEELPARGRIDWNRTAQATWRERPDELPLEVQTRQRRRHFATPENLLAVVTLLEYKRDGERLLDKEAERGGAPAIRHPLNEIVNACTRELAFLQFAGLVAECTEIVQGYAAFTSTDLEGKVRSTQLRGHNSAYADLLEWRRKLRRLRLLSRAGAVEARQVLGADPNRDNYLYQLWLFYELGDLLKQQGRLLKWNYAEMAITFTWGEGGEQRPYCLQHDQAIKDIGRHWGSEAPGVRPDFYIWRPDRQVLKNGKDSIWHEPGYVLDAKYYRPRESEKDPANPVKRMIADLQLTGERHGALLFAFHNQERDEQMGQEALSTRPRRIAPLPAAAQYVQPDVEVSSWRVPPHASPAQVQETLQTILQAVHSALQERIEVECHGIFLDSLSVADAKAFPMTDRYGKALENDPSDLLLCPKPHVGPWRVDLVSRARHCCQDAALCHIAGRPGRRKPVRPPRTPEELLKELEHLFAEVQKGDLDEDLVAIISRQVEGVTRRFAEIAGAYRRLDIYYNRLRDLGMHNTLQLLGPTERESLALAIFLVEQLDSVNASDYSAPAIHIGSVMELEIRRRVFACPDLVGDLISHKKQTLGILPFLRRSPELGEGNWERIVQYAGAHWNGVIDPDQADQAITFDMFVKAVDTIAQYRNRAAHADPLPRNDYNRLLRDACQAGALRIGTLNALLLAWKESSSSG